jgi:hypothetical protein
MTTLQSYNRLNITETYIVSKILEKRWERTSNKVKSVPPVIFHTMPVALSIPISSSGDCMALRAASLALDLPENLSQEGKFHDS